MSKFTETLFRMKTKLSLLFSAALFCTVIYSCGNAGNDMTTDTKKPGLEITPDQLAVTTDLACGMDMSKAKISDTAQYNGGIYAFCSDHCKQTFKADPEKYLAKK
jgi:YHS domain-containing protein